MHQKIPGLMNVKSTQHIIFKFPFTFQINVTNLTIREQLIFTRLRRRPTLVSLCDTFGIAVGSGSKSFVTWVLFLEKELEFLINFSIMAEMEGLKRPKVFRDAKYSKVRSVIDCTELYIQKPSLPSSQRRTFSQYKSHNTFKLLVSMSPICHLNFSKLYTGSISDKQVVQQSGFLSSIEPADAIVAGNEKCCPNSTTYHVKQECFIACINNNQTGGNIKGSY